MPQPSGDRAELRAELLDTLSRAVRVARELGESPAAYIIECALFELKGNAPERPPNAAPVRQGPARR